MLFADEPGTLLEQARSPWVPALLRESLARRDWHWRSAQAYAWGLCLAGSRDVADYNRQKHALQFTADLVSASRTQEPRVGL